MENYNSKDETFNQINRASNQINKVNLESRRDNVKAKERLREVFARKLKTTMIGEIAKVEHFLGHLWGHGLDEKDCTDDQLDLYEIWQQCRDEMLNLGNSQLRAASSELDLYNVEWKGHVTNFSFKGRNS